MQTMEVGLAGENTAEAIIEPELNLLPEETEMLAQVYAGASRILEYGVGGTTVLAARSTDAELLSIECDEDAASRMTGYLEKADLLTDQVRIHWEYIGPTKKWGYPADQSRWRRYPEYALAPWESFKFRPDVVTINGRFRLACFAATMMFCKAPTTVLFADYANRDAYHAVSQFVKPSKVSGRMAKFVVEPSKVKGKEFSTLVRWFFLLK